MKTKKPRSACTFLLAYRIYKYCKILTHCRLNTLPHYILEESNFYFRYVRLWDLHIPRKKWLNYLQTVETLIRHRILRRLIWVCQLPFCGSPDYNGLIWWTETALIRLHKWSLDDLGSQGLHLEKGPFLMLLFVFVLSFYGPFNLLWSYLA